MIKSKRANVKGSVTLRKDANRAKPLTFCLNGTNAVLIFLCTQSSKPCCTCVLLVLIWHCLCQAVLNTCKRSVHQHSACFRHNQSKTILSNSSFVVAACTSACFTHPACLHVPMCIDMSAHQFITCSALSI